MGLQLRCCDGATVECYGILDYGQPQSGTISPMGILLGYAVEALKYFPQMLLAYTFAGIENEPDEHRSAEGGRQRPYCFLPLEQFSRWFCNHPVRPWR